MEEEKRVEKTFAELGVREELVKACERLGWKIPSKPFLLLLKVGDFDFDALSLCVWINRVGI